MGSRRKGNKAIGYLTQSMRWWYRRRRGGITHPPTHTPTMAKPNEIYASDQSDQSFWYFAYGSNMRLSTMTGRGITPLTMEVVEVTTHYLTFDIFGIPYPEPSYASIAEFPSTGTVSVSSPSGFGTRQVPAVGWCTTGSKSMRTSCTARAAGRRFQYGLYERSIRFVRMGCPVHDTWYTSLTFLSPF